MKINMRYFLYFIFLITGSLVQTEIQKNSGILKPAAMADFMSLEEVPTSLKRSIKHDHGSIPHDLPVPHDVAIPVESMPDDSDSQNDTNDNNSNFLAAQASIIGGDTVIPPDTMGAVGPNHLVVTLSDRVTIQNKSGAILVTKSPDSFWSPLGTNLSPFDPRVAYDPYNNRWIMTVGSSPFSANSGILLAVSATSDPTGTWYYYRIDVDSGNLLWADQPSFGFTKDWITISANTYQINGGFNGTKIWALNKAKAYSNTGITYTSFTTTGMGGSQIPAQTYDNTLPTQYFVQEWNSHINGNGYLHVYKIEGPVDTPTFSSVGFAVAPAPWNAYTPMINGGFAPQAGTTNRIMTGDARIINVVYRNGFLWAAHTIFLPAVTPVRASAQWWQLDTSANIIQRGRVDDPTATATNGGFFYAYPSVTVNANNDVLVGYTRFSSNTYASAAFSYRRFSDPLNTLPSSQVFQPGLAIYTLGGGAVRWGDYSNSLVDPVNNIDFWTIQEYAEVNNHWGIAWGHLAAKIC